MIAEPSSPAADTAATARKRINHHGRGRPVERFREVRSTTERLCRPLAVEDYVVQSMPDASPAKWHLAHTTWFFETFVLAAGAAGLPAASTRSTPSSSTRTTTPSARASRAPRRGLLSRPTVDEVHRYRAAVDHGVVELLGACSTRAVAAIAPVVTLGLHHEQQHQELILTDLKHVFSLQPAAPGLPPPRRSGADQPPPAAGLRGAAGGDLRARPVGRPVGRRRASPSTTRGRAHRVFLQAVRAWRTGW